MTLDSLSHLPQPGMALVQFPNEQRYVPHAHSYRGYLVQRRYRGMGEPDFNGLGTYYNPDRGENLLKGYSNYEAYWHPYLNTLALRLAGFTLEEILAWSTAHPNAIFDHPTFSTFCLRWGENAHGITVQRFTSPLPRVDTCPPIYFTPHSCWQTGMVYYEIASYPDLTREEAIYEALRSVGVRTHDYVEGEEGTWGGFFITDRPATEHILADMGRSFVLGQRVVEYFVEYSESTNQPVQRDYYTCIEVAQDKYYSLREMMSRFSSPQPWAKLGIIERFANEQTVLYKRVVAQCVMKDLRTEVNKQPSHCSSVSELQNPTPMVIPRFHLSLLEFPQEKPYRTLASLLRQQLLCIPAPPSPALQDDSPFAPGWPHLLPQFTLADLAEVASWLKYTPAQLLQKVSDELTHLLSMDRMQQDSRDVAVINTQQDG